MRTFKHFPEKTKCPICGKKDDKECVLVAIDGTEDGNIAEGKPIHLGCINLRLKRIGDDHVIYQLFNYEQ